MAGPWNHALPAKLKIAVAAMAVTFATSSGVTGSGSAALAQQAKPAPAQSSASAGHLYNLQPYRRAVRDLYIRLYPPCALTGDGQDETAGAPARALFAQFRENIGTQGYADAFDAGVADAQHWLSVIDVTCSDNSPSGAVVEPQLLAQTRSALAELRAMSNVPRSAP